MGNNIVIQIIHLKKDNKFISKRKSKSENKIV